MAPWFANIANFKAIRMIPPHFTKNQRRCMMLIISYGINHTYSRDVQATFFEDVFPKKNRKVCYDIVMVPTMLDTSMEIGQLQRSSKVVSIGLYFSKMHSNLSRNVIDAKEQAQ
ncbi:hypothetical protein PIB30_093815 [Stylosanthes scabra]|uniref:Uncharacterized protein n=1 Tax=Stylosanthes scabra TaxID=79078 RepID=A0ABU6ZU31_9FABA|nr:hypothetical protein [Stylosanthes scabra]